MRLNSEIEAAQLKLEATRRRREHWEDRERRDAALLAAVKKRGERPPCAQIPVGHSPACSSRTKFEIEFPLEGLIFDHDSEGWVPICGQHFRAMLDLRLSRGSELQIAHVRSWDAYAESLVKAVRDES